MYARELSPLPCGLAALLAATLLAAALLASRPAHGAAAGAEPAAPPADSKATDELLENFKHAIEEGKARAVQLQDQSAALARELETIRRQLIETAKATQDQEQRTSELEGTLDELRTAEEDKARALAHRRGQLAVTLAALERLALYPPAALVAQPESPIDTARSALLLRTVVPTVEARAVRLHADLDTLGNLRRQMDKEREALAAAQQNLASGRQQLAALLEHKAALYRETEAERRSAEDRVTRLSAQARDLRDLMDRIEAERAKREALARLRPSPAPQPPGTAAGATDEAEGRRYAALPPPGHGGRTLALRPFSRAQGHLTPPARGEIVQEFGASAGFGVTSKGLTIRTRPGAQVVAPYDGQVVFAGPFRGYGQILIIEHSEGYHSLLSGLSRTDAVAGQWVLAGEPVGVMGQQTGDGPELYVELRRNGRPINPLPWLALHNGKVSG